MRGWSLVETVIHQLQPLESISSGVLRPLKASSRKDSIFSSPFLYWNFPEPHISFLGATPSEEHSFGIRPSICLAAEAPWNLIRVTRIPLIRSVEKPSIVDKQPETAIIGGLECGVPMIKDGGAPT